MSDLLIALTDFPNEPVYDGLEETTKAEFEKIFLEEDVRMGNNPLVLRKLCDGYYSAGRATWHHRIYSLNEKDLVSAVKDHFVQFNIKYPRSE